MLFMALLASLLGIGALNSTLGALRSFITIVRPLRYLFTLHAEV